MKTKSTVLFLLLLSLNLSSSRAQIRPNISLGTGITAGSNDTWRSINGDFAFGFFPLGSNHLYLLGVWFDRTPKPTLVWSANRDSPAPSGSTIRLTFAGQFFLTYTNGTVQPIYTGEAAALGFMQDNGNMVLRDGSSRVMWESFGYPTDTILPTQTLAGGGKLYSSSRDYSTGRFMLEMQANDGNLVLSAYRFSDPGYWYTGTLFKNVSLLFNQSAFLQLLNGSHHNIYSLTRNLSNQIQDYRDYYHRVSIDEQGNLQQWAHHKTNNSGGLGVGWVSIWKAIEEPCTVNAICGPYGMCISPSNQTATCQCIPGYIPLDPDNVSRGCRPQTVLNYCGRGSTTSNNFTVTVMEDSDFPFEGFADLTRVRNVDLEGCQRALMEDCYSHAAAFVADSSSYSSSNNSRCIMKRMPLLNARLTSSTKGIKALIKLPLNITTTTTTTSSNPSVNGKRNKFNVRRFLFVGLIVSAILALLSLFSAVYYHPVVRSLVQRKRRSSNGNAVGITYTNFTYRELQVATKGFSHVIGRGSSAIVYLGTFVFNDLQIDLAVKRLETDIEKSDQEFTTELKVIGKTHHKNLVRLLGFCVENNQRILVYELMSNGSMSRILEVGEKLRWSLRAQIVIGVARGLSYLHDQCAKQIIHCDIKPENILLDSDYIAKIADFGLSKLLKKEQTRTETNARGTAGYMAPEWLRNAPVTSKVDVYSFGVVLLEIICCRRHIELHRVDEESEEEEEDLVLGDWVLSCVVNGKLEVLVSHEPEVVSDMKTFERMALVGLWCTHPDPFLRPCMKRVVQMVEGIVDVGIPPQLYNRMSCDLTLLN